MKVTIENNISKNIIIEYVITPEGDLKVSLNNPSGSNTLDKEEGIHKRVSTTRGYTLALETED